MKKILLLTIALILVILMHGQIPSQKVLVYPQTWVVRSTVSTFRVISCNDSISKKIVFLTGIVRFTAAQKEDRYGTYWERSFYFSNSSWNRVVLFIDSINLKL